MFVGYGTYGAAGFYKHEFNPASIKLTLTHVRSPWRGRRYATKARMEVMGELSCSHATDSIDTQINNFVTAYADDRKTLALYQDDGTITSHALSATAFTLVDGPHVVAHMWPKGDRGEYTDHRTYIVIAEALYDNVETGDSTCKILRYEETFQYIGISGPKWFIEHDQDGNFRTVSLSVTKPRTMIRMIQSGTSLGWGGYVLPFVSAEPAFLHDDQIVQTWGGPTEGTNRHKEYKLTWVYPHTLPVQVVHAPQVKTVGI